MSDQPTIRRESVKTSRFALPSAYMILFGLIVLRGDAGTTVTLESADLELAAPR